MKRIKPLIVLLVCMFSSLLFFACKEPIKVETITLNTESIVLKPNESFDLEVTIAPKNATNKNIKYVLTNEIVSIKIDENDNKKAKIIADKGIDENVTTFLQVISEDENARSKTCMISIQTDKTKLMSPQNLSYDSDKQCLYWDKNEAGSGYKLDINIEGETPKEIVCATNSYFIGDLFNKKVTAKVKTLGDDIYYTDSDYCEESIKFLQLSKPNNLTNEGKNIKFSKVENADYYNLYVYKDNEQVPYILYKIEDSEFDENVGYQVNLLDNANIKFDFVVEAGANATDDYVVYPSVKSESISVTKIATPKINQLDFKFSYKNKTFSWKNIVEAEKYILSRNDGEWTKVLDKNVTSFVIDDDANHLNAGSYSYSIKIIGNNKEYLDSDFSESIVIEKLQAPELKIVNGELKWDEILNSNGYLLKINDETPFKVTTNKYSMISRDAGQYTFKIASDGNNEYTIPSDFSDAFIGEKLLAPELPTIFDNKYLCVQASPSTTKVRVYITYNERASQFETNSFDSNNKAYIDLTEVGYQSGKYKAYFICFADNCFTSEDSATIEFERLNNTNTLSLNDGILNYSLVENAQRAEFYLNGTKISGLDAIDINENETYSLQMKFYPSPNSNFIVSALSDNFEFSKNPAPNKLYIENGIIKCDASNVTNKSKIRYSVTKKGTLETEIYNSLESIRLEDNNIYTIKTYVEGDNLTINSDYSNYITVKPLPRVTDFILSENTLTFSDINASTYTLYIETNQGQNIQSKTLGKTMSYNFNEFLKEIFGDEYAEIYEDSKMYVKGQGGDLLDTTLQDTVILVNRENYIGEENSKSNIINFKVLQSTKNLRAAQLTDYLGQSDSDKDINELYFDCDQSVTLFNFKYTKDSEERNIILSKNNYLTEVKRQSGLVTYLVDTSFMNEGTYNLEIESFSAESVITSPDNETYTYILNARESAKLEGITKLKSVELLCSDNKVKIISDEDYLYLLKINGKVIYEDILGEGQDLKSLLALAQTNPTGALEEIKKFQTKERIIPDKYTGTFSVSAVSVIAPTTILELTSNKSAIRSEDAMPLSITRLDVPIVSLNNGILEWTPVTNATQYEVYTYELSGSTYEEKDKIATITPSSEESLIYDCYENFKSNDGTTKIIGVRAITTEDNYLNSLTSKKIDFRILAKPQIKIQEGIINWNSIDKAEGYKLEVFKDGNLYTQYIFDKSIIKFDAMLKSNGDEFESGTYKLKLTALGNKDDGDTTTLMSSISCELDNVVKLEKPANVKVKKGDLLVSAISSSEGVGYYKLLVNKGDSKQEEKLEFSTNTFVYGLPEKYTDGTYTILCQAMAGEGNYLNSNVSGELIAERLPKIEKISILDGEIVWTKVEKEEYSAIYKLSVKQENTIKEEEFDITSYIMSKDDAVSYGVYSVEIRVIGDDNYISSNINTLFNVAKLDSITNIRIEDGILNWDRPNIVFGNYRAPNEIFLEIEKMGNKQQLTITDNDVNFIFGEDLTDGTYSITSYSIGNKESSYSKDSGALNFVNSEVITKGGIYKLKSPYNLNINDGINLTWDNDETYITKKYILNMTQIIDNVETQFSGVLESNNSSIRFDQIRYYENDVKDKILILSNDSRITGTQIKIGEKLYDVKIFTYQGMFKINIANFGDNLYLNSEISNTIDVTLPDPVKGLKVEHGRITWDESSSANGYILTISRKNGASEPDEEFNKYNENIYVTGQTHYNLTDVLYYYDISIRAYSISTEEQTIASIETKLDTYYFNSFESGNGTEEKPYLITNEEKLNLIKYNNFAYYELSSDITLTKSFSPLFSDTNQFVGTINGKGYKIINLNINSYFEYTGLLGYIGEKDIVDDRLIYEINSETGLAEYVRQTNIKTYTGYVFNINLENVNIIEGTFVGAIAGVSEGKIEKIMVSGSICSVSEIAVSISGSQKEVYSGSIVGKNLGEIINCINDALISPSAKTILYSGGISATNEGKIENCTNNGKVSGIYAGGITAINEEGAIITSSLSTGDIVCYNLISNSTTLYARAGGISAVNRKSAQITDCIVDNYNFGMTNGGIRYTSTESSTQNIYLGGLVGENAGKCERNYVRIDLNSQINSSSIVFGKLIGYNGDTNNGVLNNYCLTGDRGQAITMLGNGNSIGTTNEEISNEEFETKI